ncbi:extracellular solute-binding protein [Paenibacillus sacheonensis]|uniref:Extracellular solute-binding protein n=1 Tax=Paenibacillus sacheonensis TaxID=742054 RepID=A0A7X5BYN7_9BACL|nr:extracellular solute-binding protein [Paenibacillus sacheonensis]MBM7569210.1 raffinose/stachyose/melibiose transport system substrate-binding protein [Paenibacillus sacheonensis]NBC71778.1 extracellular solute-binding protein [Paenibacillus sacheonensis]
MNKSLAVAVTTLMSASLVLSACGSSNGNSNNTDNANGNASTNTTNDTAANAPSNTEPANEPVAKDVTLSLRHTQIKETSKVRLKILQDVVAKTEQENPGLKINLEGIDEVVNRDQKLKAEMAAGNPPDMFEVFGGADLSLYVKAGRMLDLTPIIEELGIQDKFASLDEFTIDGNVYGLPFGGYSEGVFYNKKMFADMGLAPPKTFDELLTLADAIKAKGKTPFALAAKDAWVNGMLWNTVMERHVGIKGFEGLVTGETKWTDPDFVAGFADYAKLVDNDYFTKGALGLAYAEQGAKFLKGDAAMVFTGTWDANRFTGDEAGDLRGSVGYFSFPSIAGGKGDQTSINASYSNGFGFSSNLTDDQKAMVKAFIKNFFNEAIQKRTLLEDKVLPSMKLSDLSGVDPLISEVLQVMANASSSWKAFDAIVQPSVGADVGVGLQELIGKVKKPDAVAKQIQASQDKANKQ